MNATPLKEAELRTLARCAACEKLLGQTGSPIFFNASRASPASSAAAPASPQPWARTRT